MRTSLVKDILILALLSVSLFHVANCTAREKSWWTPPPGGVIRDKVAAISIARAIWVSLNPGSQIPTEQGWQEGMDAVRVGNVWQVTEKPLPKGSIGGGIEIDLDARDCHVVQIVFTQ
jgi:hypothetical protein